MTEKGERSKLNRLNSTLVLVIEASCSNTLFLNKSIALLYCLALIHFAELGCLFVSLPLLGILLRIDLKLF